MKKQKITKFGKNYYLLGKRKENGAKVWLEEGHFDCDWYWGIGYVEEFNARYTDINMHTHFDSLFLNGKKCCIDLFKEYFNDTTLTEGETWQLLENIKTLYTMREYSDTLYIGGSNITSNENAEIIKNNEEYKRINEVVIPKLLETIYKILGGV